MAEWSERTEEMFQSWSESQKKLMETWTENIKGLGMLQESELWDKTISTWEETVKKTLDAQTDWTQAWVLNLGSIEGIPEKAVEAADRFKSMSERWSATQEQMWTNWFDMLKNFDPAKLSDAWGEAFKSPFQAWQQASDKVMKAQSDWLRAWMGTKEEE